MCEAAPPSTPTLRHLSMMVVRLDLLSEQKLMPDFMLKDIVNFLSPTKLSITGSRAADTRCYNPWMKRRLCQTAFLRKDSSRCREIVCALSSDVRLKSNLRETLTFSVRESLRKHTTIGSRESLKLPIWLEERRHLALGQRVGKLERAQSPVVHALPLVVEAQREEVAYQPREVSVATQATELPRLLPHLSPVP